MTEGSTRGDLREVLLARALDLLSAGGESGPSLRAVARSAGVSPMAPYRHFADKEALLAAVAARGFVALRECMAEADADAAPGDEIARQCLAYLAFAQANTALFRLMFGPPRGSHHPALRAAGEATYALTAERVAQVAPLGEQQSRTMAIWAMIHGLAVLSLDGQVEDRVNEPLDTLARQMIAMLPLGSGNADSLPPDDHSGS